MPKIDLNGQDVDDLEVDDEQGEVVSEAASDVNEGAMIVLSNKFFIYGRPELENKQKDDSST